MEKSKNPRSTYRDHRTSRKVLNTFWKSSKTYRKCSRTSWELLTISWIFPLSKNFSGKSLNFPRSAYNLWENFQIYSRTRRAYSRTVRVQNLRNVLEGVPGRSRTFQKGTLLLKGISQEGPGTSQKRIMPPGKVPEFAGSFWKCRRTFEKECRRVPKFLDMFQTFSENLRNFPEI